MRRGTCLAKSLPDQAEGLRRLFAADVRRMIALVAVGGHSNGRLVAAGLAVALAGHGKKVLLLDEFLSAGELHAAFGISPKHDLGAVLLSRIEIEAAIMPTASGVHVLAGGGHAHTLPRPRMEARIGLVNAFYRLAGKYDVVLVNVRADSVGSRPSFAWACQDVVVLCGSQPDMATEAYTQIKLLHQADERRFHLLFCGLDQIRAQILYRNVAAVSRRYLHLMPEDLGILPGDADVSAEFFGQLAWTVQSWPLPEHKAGHFPALMRRLLRGTNPRVLQAMSK